MAVYILDSNFFIQAHRDNYPLDIAFSFWNKVKQLAGDGKIISIDKVKKEIYDKNDDLENWCKDNLLDDFFKDSSNAMGSYAQVTAWAFSKSDQYMQNALNEFLDADEADAFIVAYALSEDTNCVVVTQEKSEPNIKRKIKIPEVCNALNVQFVNTIAMLRQLNETF
jgi:hypothetical protein